MAWPIHEFRRLTPVPEDQDRAGSGSLGTGGNRGTLSPVREAWIRDAARFVSGWSPGIGGPNTGTAGITTAAMPDGANSNAPFAPESRFAYAFRVDRVPKAFLHSRMLAANKSGSMMMKTTTIAMLSALTCMMIFLSIRVIIASDFVLSSRR
jgi:hypothetical protein